MYWKIWLAPPCIQAKIGSEVQALSEIVLEKEAEHWTRTS